MPMHDDELAIDPALVRSLLADLSPAYAAQPLRRLEASGSSNVLFRLGSDLLVRLPRQPGGSATIAKEQRWLSHVAPAVPVPVPEVVAVGPPGHGYPEHWSLVRWIAGDVPAVPAPNQAPRHHLARDLASVLRGLRRLDVPRAAAEDPALRWYRGEPLSALDADTRISLEQCAGLPGLDLDLDACSQVWQDTLALPGADTVTEPRWLHADLLAENLVVQDGRLAGVLDFGGLSVGDPTVDLVVAWELLDAAARDTFRALVEVDDATWLRGRAWALALGVMTFPYYWTTMPARCADRLAMTRAVLADAGC